MARRSRCRTSAVIPQPRVRDGNRVYCPGAVEAAHTSGSARRRPRFPIAGVPPAGMASRALRHRFSSAWCSSPASAYTAEVLAEPHFQPDPRPRQRLHHGRQVADQSVGIDVFQAEQLAAAEAQQLAGERGGAVRRLEHPLQVGVALCLRLRPSMAQRCSPRWPAAGC